MIYLLDSNIWVVMLRRSAPIVETRLGFRGRITNPGHDQVARQNANTPQFEPRGVVMTRQ
jgi:hypothetical protein